MKRFLALLVIALMLLSSSAYAAGEYDSYIVKIKDEYPSVMLQSLSATSVDDGYIIVSEESVDSLDMSAVEYMLPNYKLRLMQDTPNDPYYSFQWHLETIKAPYPWGKDFLGRELAGKNENVRIAIIDSGIDVNHPDLKDRIVATENYVKDSVGSVDSDYMEEYELHGTSVAGTAAAIMNNTVGVTGVSQADIVVLRVHETDEMKAAIKDAVDKYDCDVINISQGIVFQKYEAMDKSIWTTEESYKVAIENTIRDFMTVPINEATEAGVIVVASAGNFATGVPADNSGNIDETYPINPAVYPAYCGNVIAAGAVGKTKSVSYFSTYNDMVDIAAPGELIYTTKGNYARAADSDYDYLYGTSFSSPQVAAAAAIVKGINPDINHDSFEALIKFSSEDLGDKGIDDYYGWGLLNLEEMTKLASGEKLGTAEPVYDASTQKLTLTYADFGAATGTESVRVAVYNADNTLSHITAAMALPQAETGEHTVSVTTEEIEIPSGGYIKAYCIRDWAKMIPAADIVEYKN